MSLNKLTNSTDYLNKQYLNIGCNDIKCSSLEIGGNPTVPADDGRFTPVITVDEGSAINSQVGVYNVVGVPTQAVIDISIKCQIVVATSTTAYRLTITLPDSWKCFNNTDIVATGTLLCKGAIADLYIVEDCISVEGQSTVLVKFNILGNTSLPVGVGQNFVNFNFKCIVKK